jgi:hypothetical protein
MAQTSSKAKTQAKSDAKPKSEAKSEARPKSDPKSDVNSKSDGKPKRGTGPTNARARAERQKKLREIRKQVKEGTLTIRKMTAAERKKFPPRTPDAKSKRSRRRG